MSDNYILMHKDVQCGALSIERETGDLLKFALIDKNYAPFLGNADDRNIRLWWKFRAVPAARKDMEEIVRRAGSETNADYLAKNLALSITDTYWICPLGTYLKWEDIRLTGKGSGAEEIVTFHNATSYDPNASLGGQMNKYWDISGSVPVLTKIASAHYGQQSINELFATEVHSRQAADVPYVSYYEKEPDDNSILSCCEAFTSGSVEFVPAYEILRSRKLLKSRSDHDQYIDICEEHGVDRAVMQAFMDYMVLTDFAMSNTDRHLQNFGMLRNPDTMEIIGPAPLFDTGNSMFYNMGARSPLSRAELLDVEISSLYPNEEKMLKHVTDRAAIDMDRLPTEDEVREFYVSHGIPEEKARFIAGSYANKTGLLADFQKGKRISLYMEKKREGKNELKGSDNAVKRRIENETRNHKAE